MFERFTDRARRVIVLAQEEARQLEHDHIGTEHLLLGLVNEGEGVAAKVLASLGVSPANVRREVVARIGRGGVTPEGHISFSPRAKRVLELALREGLSLGQSHVGTEHLLLGLVREGEGVAAQVLIKLGATLDRVRQAVIVALQEAQVSAGQGLPREGLPVCPTCHKALDGGLVHRRLHSVGLGENDRDVVVVFCSACGCTLGTASA